MLGDFRILLSLYIYSIMIFVKCVEFSKDWEKMSPFEFIVFLMIKEEPMDVNINGHQRLYLSSMEK